jgi:hypothetical protein
MMGKILGAIYIIYIGVYVILYLNTSDLIYDQKFKFMEPFNYILMLFTAIILIRKYMGLKKGAGD